ncbi:hypothetical protein Tco_1107419 [Tanacetum coccineum]
MHNNIMAAGSKERPTMLGPGRYSQWHSRFLRYLDTKSNGEYLRKCIFEGPYMPTNVLIAAVEDEIYSTVDACNTAKEMWTAIERLQQGAHAATGMFMCLVQAYGSDLDYVCAIE